MFMEQDSQEFNDNGFRRPVKKDSFFEFERLRYVKKTVRENTVVWTLRENRNIDWDGACSCV